MARRRHSLNPAKVKIEVSALETTPPPEVFQRRLDLRRRLSVALLCLLTVVLLTISFAPYDLWYLAYAALVPWALTLAGESLRRWSLLCATLAGTLFWAVNLYWLWWVTLVGYAALVIYLSAYWVVAALILRAAMRRNLPMWLVLPVVWVSLEYARSYAISGFPWFFLAHSQYTQTRLIQIADVTGQYGVSFFVAAVNGALVDLLSAPLFVRTRRGPQVTRRIVAGLAFAVAAAGGLIGYGSWQLGRQTTEEGPVIGIVQQSFPIALGVPSADSNMVLRRHAEATRELKDGNCDLVLWPETMLPTGMNAEILKLDVPELKAYASEMANLTRAIGCPSLAGGSTLYPDLNAADPGDRWVKKNSALWFDPDAEASGDTLPSTRQQYSKVHLVPFSEYVPLKETWPWMHRAMRWFVPPVMDQLTPGREFTLFELKRGRKTWRLATPICYEGTFDYVCREMVFQNGRKAADILANLSNDGWFVWKWWPTRGSNEHSQHLVQYCFRAVENRVPVVRAVNTGISASIDSCGRILAVVEQYQVRSAITGNLLLDGAKRNDVEYLQGHGPRILVDSRVSVYSRCGDVFAMAVSLAGVVLSGWLAWKRRKTEEGAQR